MAANPQKPILVQDNSPAAKIARLERQNAAMKRLVRAVQDLSLARTLDLLFHTGEPALGNWQLAFGQQSLQPDGCASAE